MAKYTQSLEEFVGHYIELSETVSGDAEVGLENGRIAWRSIAKGQAEELRSMASQLESMGVEPWNRLTPAIEFLRRRADELEDSDD